MFCDVYGWRQEGRFAVVPSLLGKPAFACVPGLSYTDLGAAEARELAREMAGRSFNIRVLDETPGEGPPGAPAVLRLDLAAFDHEREAVWKNAFDRPPRSPVVRGAGPVSGGLLNVHSMRAGRMHECLGEREP